MERVELKPFCFEHLDLFAWKEDDLKTYSTRSEIMDALIIGTERGDCWTAIFQGRILVIGGVIKHTKKTGYCFTIFSEYSQQSKVGSARCVRRMFENILGNMELHRIVTYNREGAHGHNKWCEWLGFKLETPVEKFDDEGNTYNQYSLVR